MKESPHTDILTAIPELEQDIPAEQFMMHNFWVPVAWGVGIALVLAAAALLLWYRRRRKHRPAPPSEEAIALKALGELEQQLPSMRECSLRLSLIIRRFLTGQTQDPALYETHEEFSQRMDTLSAVPEECQYDTRYLLEGLADLKYAGEGVDDPPRARALIEQARSLITRITSAQQKEAAAEAELARVHSKS